MAAKARYVAVEQGAFWFGQAGLVGLGEVSQSMVGQPGRVQAA